MTNSNTSVAFAHKRLDLNALYNDQSLFDNFEFKSSFCDKINKKRENDFIYNNQFNDTNIDKSQIHSFVKNLDLYKVQDKCELNFGKDPFTVNEGLKKVVNDKDLNDEFRYSIMKYFWSEVNFCLFKYAPKSNSNNNKGIDNNNGKTLEINWENKVPYLYNIDNNLVLENRFRYILRKTMLPIRYINNIPIIIKDHILLNKKRENRIIIMDNMIIDDSN